MRLRYVTITGADENTSFSFMKEISKTYPWVEWGVLFSESRLGEVPRYPGPEWMRELVSVVSETPGMNCSAHLCGNTMRKFAADLEYSDGSAALAPWWLTSREFNQTFKRVQMNFSASDPIVTPGWLRQIAAGFMETSDQYFITQHNPTNHWVWGAVQDEIDGGLVQPHQVLVDASGGAGVAPTEWPMPIAGILTGYAGGINPGNVGDVLLKLEEMIPHGITWIDMESGIRDEQNQLSEARVRNLLQTVARMGEDHNWFSK